MQLYRITFQVDGDEVTDVVIESTRGCPQCDAGASHDDLDADHHAEDGERGSGLHVVGPTSSTKSGRDGADSASSF